MIIRGFSYLLSGNALYALSQWVVVVLIARLGTLEDQGAYNYALAVLAPLTMLARLNLRAVLITDSRREFRFADYMAARVIGAVVPLAAVPLIMLLAGQRSHALWLMVAVAGMKGIEGVSDLIHGQLQWQHDYPRIFWGLAFRAVAMLAAFAFGMAVGGSLHLSVAITISLWMMGAWYVDRGGLTAECRSIPKHPAVDPGAVFRACWPLGITMALVSLFNYAPVYVLEGHGGAEQVGLYAAVSYLWLVGVFVATALIQVVSTHFSQEFHRDLRRYLVLVAVALGVISGVGGLGVIILWRYGEEVVTWLYGPAYAGLGQVVGIMAIGVLVNAVLVLLGMTLTIARAYRSQLALNVLSVAIVLGLCMWLIPENGIEGAALALVLSLCAKLGLSVVLNTVVLAEQRRSRRAA